MKTCINIKERKKAIALIQEFKNKKYVRKTIKLDNVNLKRINSFLKYNIFAKNDLYIEAETLFELMQPEGKKGLHNYHNLSPEMVVDTLNSLVEPYCVFAEKSDRYAIVSTKIHDEKGVLMAVIAINSPTASESNARVNKLVTMFPKKNINSYLKGLEKSQILYINDFLLIKK